MTAFTQTIYDDAVAAIQARTSLRPAIGLVLGSGLGGLADTLEDRIAIPYEEIPGWPQSTVHGHSGKLVIGRLEGQIVVAQQGRAHFYEGYTMQQITMPIRIMHLLGAHTVILSNAAGGLNPDFVVGDLMLMNDHINFVGMAGSNPLMGPNDERFGPRFVGMTQSYDKRLRELAHQAAVEAGVTLREGVYIALSGPNYETPAEIRMLRMMGADAVGMSTVHEVLVARHAGMRVIACSGITNVAIDNIDSNLEANHEEVLDAGKILVPKLTAVVKGVLKAL
ncbi:MAG: purine-nucleoside phosphorylase [Burkholderiales bacterium]|nr:purine-nucleoside phosphorylase [Anaerolineae bacterium]